jgi:hypothetical protein
LVVRETYAAQMRERMLSMLCCVDLAVLPDRQSLLARYAAINELLTNVNSIVPAAASSADALSISQTLLQESLSLQNRTVETFWVLKRYQYQYEKILRLCGNAVESYHLADLASEMALNPDDLSVQVNLYNHCCCRLRRLPRLICRSEAADEGLDPKLVALYEKATTVSSKTLNRLFRHEYSHAADACVTLAKLTFGRQGARGSDSVLLHPILPGVPGAVIASPSLLLDSVLFRCAMLFTLIH